MVWILRLQKHQRNKLPTVYLPPAPKRIASPKITTPLLDWSALRLLNRFRLVLWLILASVFYLVDDQTLLGTKDSLLFEVILLGYVVSTLGSVYLIRLQKPSITNHFYLQSYFDILLICGFIYASGGLESGLGALLLINLALLSQLAPARHALVFAAIASMFITAEELLASLIEASNSLNLEMPLTLSALLLTTSWIISGPSRELTNRPQITSSRSRAGHDVDELVELNEEIIKDLDFGIIVVDRHYNVQLINDTARVLLSAEFIQIPVNLKVLCPELLKSLKCSTMNPHQGVRPFKIAANQQTLLPHFINLSKGGILAKLDDNAQLEREHQQLKLASLGRLSAHVASEISHPLSEISQALQLIQESETSKVTESGLLSAAYQHSQCINRINDDVIQLYRRKKPAKETISVNDIVNGFASQFLDEGPLHSSQLIITAEHAIAVANPTHLDRILWNLCTYRLQIETEKLTMALHCWQSGVDTTIIDVKDNGRGISDIEAEHLFNPFHTTLHENHKVGLFIIRELCEINNATIECIASSHGAHFRITLSSTQDMAA